MAVLPPGTLLQLMYLQRRLRDLPLGRFVEIGPGSGEITQLLLDNGWTGCSYDLEPATVARLRERFSNEMTQQRFTAINDDYLSPEEDVAPESADLIISCMVMEHLEDDAQNKFMQTSAARLKPGGIMIGLVPSSPAHWGIEDVIAGHCRRYTRSSIKSLAADNHWKLLHLAGLTFPISNLLLPVSNLLVKRSEHSKLELSALERTRQSGKRKVKFKTEFPATLGILLNRFTMFPLYLLQNLCTRSESALVLYFEAQPDYGARGK